MNVKQINEALWHGVTDRAGVLPHLDLLARCPFVFGLRFGLAKLPEQPGIITVRGARQYGKSTWLEGRIRETVETHGPGSALYLNGDELRNADDLRESIRGLLPLFSTRAPVRRLFIDEVTAVKDWQQALKRLLDSGELRDVLVVNTGSKAADLRHGSERLPGRKGRLERTSYLFTPVSYKEFKRVCGEALKGETLPAYVLSGGSPVACSEIAAHGRLPEYVPEMIRDWMLGECAGAGRQRVSFHAVMECLLRRGGSPLGQAKLATESGLANNSVAAGYVELLMDLLCVASAYAWDTVKQVRLARKRCKYHFINLLAVGAWHPDRPRSAADLRALPEEDQGRWLEWLAAQELWRRAAIRGEEMPEVMRFWQSKEHELDFVVGPDAYLEVKRGRTTPLEFSWFPKSFPKGRLTVISESRYETRQIQGLTLEEFLISKE